MGKVKLSSDARTFIRAEVKKRADSAICGDVAKIDEIKSDIEARIKRAEKIVDEEAEKANRAAKARILRECCLTATAERLVSGGCRGEYFEESKAVYEYNLDYALVRGAKSKEAKSIYAIRRRIADVRCKIDPVVGRICLQAEMAGDFATIERLLDGVKF